MRMTGSNTAVWYPADTQTMNPNPTVWYTTGAQTMLLAVWYTVGAQTLLPTMS